MAITPQPPPQRRTTTAVDPNASIPIGTVVAFAGGLDVEWLRQQGWLYCDGASLPKRDYLDLFLEIGTNFGGGRDEFNLPDLRGRFARGVDRGSARDPYAAQREPSASGGLAGDQPGSLFGDRTGRPAQRLLVLTDAGEHSHSVPHVPTSHNAYAIAGTQYALWRSDSTTTSSAGLHTHTIPGGGNKETRPINKAVYFIIKFAQAVAGGAS
jgi:microcystin-dependent protein